MVTIDPKRIRYEIFSSYRYDEVFYLLLNTYNAEEPMCKALGLSYESVTPYQDLLATALWWQTSYVAIDTVTDRVVGICISKLDYYNSGPPQPGYCYNVRYHTLMHFVNFCFAGGYELMSDAHVTYKIDILAVNCDYRRLGIAQNLVHSAEHLAKKLRCQYIKVLCSTYKTQLLFNKLGYNQLKVHFYKDYLPKGYPIFVNMAIDQPCAKLMSKKIFSEENEMML